MRRDMNFFSEFSLKKKTQDDGSSILIKTFVAIVAALVLVSAIYLGGNIAYCSIKIKNTTDKLNASDVQEKLKESDEVKAKTSALTEYDTAISTIVKSVASRSIVDTTLINQICSTLPTEVEATSINIDHSAIVLHGTSTKREAIAELEHNLGEKVDRIESCQVTSIAGDQVLTFDIKCVLKDVE